jgi:nitrile hydratase beta subunit
MNGIHDMGGMHGFGPVEHEENEPVFHAAWEGRVMGMLREVGANYPARMPGAARDIIERIEPARYLASSYYERFLEVVEQRALEEGLVTQTELAARIEQISQDPDWAIQVRNDPTAADNTRLRMRTQLHPAEPVSEPRFAVGDPVLVRNLNWPGHNRLPRYLRSKRGFIERLNGCYNIEDAHADALGPNPQTVYTVRFAGHEVWGDESETNMQVYAELWEGYLEEGESK